MIRRFFTLTDRAPTEPSNTDYVVANPVRGLLDRKKIRGTSTKLQREHKKNKTETTKRKEQFFPQTGGCSEGLGAFRFFFTHDKRRMRPQEECFVRSVVLDAHDLG